MTDPRSRAEKIRALRDNAGNTNERAAADRALGRMGEGPSTGPFASESYPPPYRPGMDPNRTVSFPKGYWQEAWKNAGLTDEDPTPHPGYNTNETGPRWQGGPTIQDRVRGKVGDVRRAWGEQSSQAVNRAATGSGPLLPIPGEVGARLDDYLTRLGGVIPEADMQEVARERGGKFSQGLAATPQGRGLLVAGAISKWAVTPTQDFKSQRSQESQRLIYGRGPYGESVPPIATIGAIGRQGGVSGIGTGRSTAGQRRSYQTQTQPGYLQGAYAGERTPEELHRDHGGPQATPDWLHDSQTYGTQNPWMGLHQQTVTGINNPVTPEGISAEPRQPRPRPY